MQVEYLKTLTDCRDLTVWGRTPAHVEDYRTEMEALGWTVHVAETPAEVAQKSNLIITTTSAKEPLLHAKDIRPGTHLTLMGTDTPGKQEVAADVLALSDICVVDSKSQCVHHGNESYAVADNLIQKDDLRELGSVISDPSLARKNDVQITTVSLTGVGVQDLQIAKIVAANLSTDLRPKPIAAELKL